VYGFGVGSDAVGKKVLKGKGFREHACVIVVVSIAFAVHMCTAKMMMMGNKRGAHAASFRRETAIKTGSCVYVLKECGKGGV
jgi:hypothetical protein